jgi:hypothetical protein
LEDIVKGSKDVIAQFKVPDYMDTVTLAKARRTLYKQDKHGEKVISNPRTAGKPRTKKINGQSLWVGMNHHLRTKIAKELKKYFYEIFRGMEYIKEYPIGIELVFYGPLGEYDLDNLCILYRKCCQDSLCGNVEFLCKIDNGKKVFYPDREKYPAIIEDDNVNFINEIPTRFVESEGKKLIINIYKTEKYEG